ncbi:MAG: class I SAM-dependent methyltransferase, partial [Planctomycetaceae bacterium]|nr:class I SAM-dependent methyltransferase [Planctomycetaceae bacterium]
LSNGWTNVEAVTADATRWEPPIAADVVTCSYSLTMIPDWFAAVDHAIELLKPGGVFGAVDFYVSRKHPEIGYAKHSWFTRTFWPTWFAFDNVHLHPDHVRYLHRRFECQRFLEFTTRRPYVPFARVPWYLFVGRKA